MSRLIGNILMLAVGLTSVIPLPAMAQTEAEPVRPVHSEYLVEAGSSHLGDSYLSPLKYTGWNAAFRFERMQAMRTDACRWNSNLKISVSVSGTENPARNADMYYAQLSGSWGMLRRMELPWQLRAGVGPVAAINLGCVYSTRNSNNPASVKADVTVGAGAYVSRLFRVGRLPVRLRWQTQLPLLGCFFSPEYDELYYEIYLGNHKGLAHFAHPGCFFRWDNMITADFDLGRTHLVVGGSSRIYSTGINHINTRIFSWNFVLGVSGDWLSVSPRHSLPHDTARIIYCY